MGTPTAISSLNQKIKKWVRQRRFSIALRINKARTWRRRRWLSASRPRRFPKKHFRLQWLVHFFIHNPIGAFLTAAFIPSILACMFLLVPWPSTPQVASQDTATAHSDLLLGTSQIVGTIVGLVFVVLIFSAEQRIQRLGRKAFLLKQIYRREYTYSLTGGILGLITFYVVAASISTFWCPRLWFISNLLNLVFFPVLMILTVIATKRLTDVDDEEGAKASILRWYKTRMLREIEVSWAQRVWVRLLRKWGIEHKGFWSATFGSPVIQGLGHGYVIDLNLKRLRSILKSPFVSKLPEKGICTISPGHYVYEGEPIVWIYNREKIEFARAISQKLSRIAIATDNAEEDVMAQLFSSTAEEARFGTAEDFSASLGMVESCIYEYYRFRKQYHICRGGLIGLQEQDVFGPELHYSMVRAALNSRDPDKRDRIFQYAERILCVSIRANHPEGFSFAAWIVSSWFLQSLRHKGRSEKAILDIYDLVAALYRGTSFSHHDIGRVTEDRSYREVGIADELLKLIIQLTKTAINSKKWKCARELVVFISDWNHEKLRVWLTRYRGHDVSPAMKKIYGLHVLALALIAGWCAYRFRKTLDPSERRELLDIIKECGNPLNVGSIQLLWELQRVGDEKVSLDQYFNATDWIRDADREPPYKSETYFPSGEWVYEAAVILTLVVFWREQFKGEVSIFNPPAEQVILNTVKWLTGIDHSILFGKALDDGEFIREILLYFKGARKQQRKQECLASVERLKATETSFMLREDILREWGEVGSLLGQIVVSTPLPKNASPISIDVTYDCETSAPSLASFAETNKDRFCLE